jgi:hypothetical protein
MLSVSGVETRSVGYSSRSLIVTQILPLQREGRKGRELTKIGCLAGLHLPLEFMLAHKTVFSYFREVWYIYLVVNRDLV